MANDDGGRDGMTGRTLTALKWTYGSAILGIVPQIIYTTVMARLLEPAAFGLIALAQVYLRFGGYFANLGIGQALIQKKELRERDVRAAFTSTTGLGILFASLAALTAPLAANLFDSPDVVPIVRALGLTFLLDGLGRTATNLLRRDLRFQTLAKIEVPTYIAAYLVVGLGSAMLGAGVWSLVAASLAQSTFAAAASYAATRHRLAPIFAVREFKELYAFGGRISVISFVQFLIGNIDVLFIGRYLDEDDLGQYNRATYLVVVPFTQLVNNLAKVLFPAFSRIQSDLPRMRGAYLSAVELLAAILLPIAVGMGVAAPELTGVVLGPNWPDAAAVLPMLAIAQAVGFVTMVDGLVFDSMARLNLKLVLELGSALGAVAIFLALGSSDTGLPAYALAMAVVALGRRAAYDVASRRVLELRYRDVLAIWVRTLAASAIVGGTIQAGSVALRGNVGDPVVLIAQMVLGGVSLALCFTHGPLVHARHGLRERLAVAGLVGGGKAGRLMDRMLSTGR